MAEELWTVPCRMVDGVARYLTPPPEVGELGLVCLGAGQQRAVHPVLDRVLRCHAAVLVTRGDGWRRTRAGRFPVVAPAIFWVRPGEMHSYGPDGADWDEHWLLFRGRDVDAYRSLGFLRDGGVIDPLPAQRLVDEAIAACDQGEPGAHVQASVLTHRFIASAARPPVSAVLRELAASAFDTVAVPDVARRLGVTEAELRAEVRARTGTTPGEYVIGLRLTRAKHLLVETTWSVARVAAAVGYVDAAYFSRLFSRRVGMSPRVFRAETALHRTRR